jgi:hypothetical protein
MDTRSIVESQLKLAYETYNKSYEQRLDDKKLCVTLWLAIVGFISTRPRLSMTGAVLFTFAPIVMFWLLDGLRAVYTRFWGARLVRLEGLLLQDQIDVEEIRPQLFLSGRGYTFREKIVALLSALFLMESVFAFYLFMALINAVSLVIYAHAK